MRTSNYILLLAGVAFMCGCDSKSPSGYAPAQTIVSQLPPQIQEAKELLKGKPRGEIRQIMIERFGRAQRFDYIRETRIPIDQWDIAGGKLAFNPLFGPSFTPEGQERIWLCKTHNPVITNLLGSYEMDNRLATADGTERHCWLGTLEIKADLSYAYKDSGQFPEQSARQTSNFFYLHPTGKVEIKYVAGITNETLLEELASKSVVAWLHFQSGDGRARQTFTITIIAPSRQLVFGASEPLSFNMQKYWESDWE